MQSRTPVGGLALLFGVLLGGSTVRADVTDPTRFAMIEAWESEAVLDAHLARESLRAAVARLAPMAAEQPKVARLRSVDEA